MDEIRALRPAVSSCRSRSAGGYRLHQGSLKRSPSNAWTQWQKRMEGKNDNFT